MGGRNIKNDEVNIKDAPPEIIIKKDEALFKSEQDEWDKVLQDLNESIREYGEGDKVIKKWDFCGQVVLISVKKTRVLKGFVRG